MIEVIGASVAIRSPRGDEDGAGDAVEPGADARAAQEVARTRDHERVAGQPAERHRAEDQAEAEERGGRLPAELREQAREEDGHLRIAEVAEEALAERAACPARPPCVVSRSTEQRLDAEEDEIRGSRDPYREERGLGRAENRGQPEARRQRPEGLAARDARGRENTRSPPAEERVANRKRRVLTGGDDHEGGDAEEREGVRDHESDLA